jgi:hypothetical protein
LAVLADLVRKLDPGLLEHLEGLVAGFCESAGGPERAGLAESTVVGERAVSQESTVVRERAVEVESTVTAERRPATDPPPRTW